MRIKVERSAHDRHMIGCSDRGSRWNDEDQGRTTEDRGAVTKDQGVVWNPQNLTNLTIIMW